MRLVFLLCIWITLPSAFCSDNEHPRGRIRLMEKRKAAAKTTNPSATTQNSQTSTEPSFKTGRRRRESKKKGSPDITFDPVVEAQAKATGPNWVAMKRGEHTDLLSIPDGDEVTRTVRDRSMVKAYGTASPGKPLVVTAKGHAVTASLMLASGQATVITRVRQERTRQTVDAPRLHHIVVRNHGRRARRDQRPARVSIKIDGIGLAGVGASDQYRPQDASMLDQLASAGG